RRACASSPIAWDEIRTPSSSALARYRRRSAAPWDRRGRAVRWLLPAKRARRVRMESCRGLGRGLGIGKRRAHALGEEPFHLLGLGAQHWLAEAAELAGQRRVDLVAYLGAAVVLHQPRQRAGGEPPHDSERRSFDLGLDLARRIHPRHFA